MIDVFEAEILAMVKKSQLKDIKKRKEIDYNRMANYLRLICASSAKFYMRAEEYEKCINNKDFKSADEYLKIMELEARYILNRVSKNKLEEEKINKSVSNMLNIYYVDKDMGA